MRTATFPRGTFQKRYHRGSVRAYDHYGYSVAPHYSAVIFGTGLCSASPLRLVMDGQEKKNDFLS